MTIEAARVEIATIASAVKAAFSTYTLLLDMDNLEPVNQATQQNPYLQIQVDMISGAQADMADHPFVAQYGQLYLAAVVKEGAGTKLANNLLDFVIPYFELKRLTLIQTDAARPQPAVTRMGWTYKPVLINFHYHRISS